MASVTGCGHMIAPLCGCPGVAAIVTKPDDMYAILATESRRLKIGRASDPQKRISDLQVGNPEDLRLLDTYVGGGYREAEAHNHFKDWHLRGEWFSSEVSDLIETCGLRKSLDDKRVPDNQSAHAKAALDLARKEAYDHGYIRGRGMRIRELATELDHVKEHPPVSAENKNAIIEIFKHESEIGPTATRERALAVLDIDWEQFKAGPMWSDFTRGGVDGYQTVLDTCAVGKRSTTLGEELRRQVDLDSLLRIFLTRPKA